ncbi:MAG: (2Fe-2S)-binding protein [Alphaproteobacteria bacterium]|nr:(2Fe-2S)-binding protein [Alphaproteobacteria bacterium]
MGERIEVTLTVNQRKRRAQVEPRLLLVDYLRHELGLKGTHVGCEQGACGACTVLLDGRTARSCLHFVAALDGAQIRTVEDVAPSPELLHPIQQAFHRQHALQCGYCTPGFVMTTLELLAGNPDPSQTAIRRALTNNLCRCTGYANIVKAVTAAGKALREGSQA